MTAQDIVKLYIPITLAAIMFTMGLGLSLADFKRVAHDPRAVLAGLLNQLLMVPLAAFGLAFAFDLPPTLAVGLVVIAACPGGPSSNLYSALARGDVALSVSLTAISSVITILTIPFVIGLGLDVFMGEARTIQLDVPATILQLILLTALPVAVGMWVRHKMPTRAVRLEKLMTRVAILLLATLIVGAILKERARLSEYFLLLGLPIVLMSLATTLFGIGSSLVARLSPRQSVTVGIEAGIQNSALGMGIAMTSLGSEEIAMPAALYGVISYFTVAVAIYIGRRIIPAPNPIHKAPN